jgi:hypothetical protein
MLRTFGVMIDLLRAETPSAVATLELPVGCDEDIMKFLRAKRVQSTAMLVQ